MRNETSVRISGTTSESMPAADLKGKVAMAGEASIIRIGRQCMQLDDEWACNIKMEPTSLIAESLGDFELTVACPGVVKGDGRERECIVRNTDEAGVIIEEEFTAQIP